MVIKPSGVRCEHLRPEQMVIIDLDGRIVEGTLTPSTDTASHLYIYRRRPEVGSIVHTHSPDATAFAALGRPIPVYLTAQADEFGGPIPCDGFALIGGEEIGKVVIEAMGDSWAVLLKNQGVFTIGENAEAAAQRGLMRALAAVGGAGVIRLSPIVTPTRPLPPGRQYANFSFDLRIGPGGTPGIAAASTTTFPAPILIEVQYTDADVADANEAAWPYQLHLPLIRRP